MVCSNDDAGAVAHDVGPRRPAWHDARVEGTRLPPLGTHPLSRRATAARDERHNHLVGRFDSVIASNTRRLKFGMPAPTRPISSARSATIGAYGLRPRATGSS